MISEDPVDRRVSYEIFFGLKYDCHNHNVISLLSHLESYQSWAIKTLSCSQVLRVIHAYVIYLHVIVVIRMFMISAWINALRKFLITSNVLPKPILVSANICYSWESFFVN